jgi:uncharacterized membrane protein YphA (DoxX/SURF4 family)
MVFGGFFLYNAINHFKQPEGLAQYAASKGVPNPDQAVLATGALLAVGATSILLGLKPKMGALALIGFLATVSPVMHDFWNAQDSGEQMNQMIHFSKNIALLGAAMALMGIPEPWPASVI